MSNSLDSLAGEIARLVPGTSVQKKSTGKDKRTGKLFVSRGNDLVKIEPNEILRGYVYPPKEQKLSPVVANTFSVECSTLLVNIADLYAGKICAALDRQHPRDLFDIKLLLENEGVTEEIKKAFVIYLVSHGRPMDELLKPNFLDIQDVYESQFKGMTKDPVAVSDLTSAREHLVLMLNKSLQDEEKDFILSIADGDPKWDLIDFEHVKELPALRWKLQNIASMDKTKRLNAAKKLAKVLGGF